MVGPSYLCYYRGQVHERGLRGENGVYQSAGEEAVSDLRSLRGMRPFDGARDQDTGGIHRRKTPLRGAPRLGHCSLSPGLYREYTVEKPPYVVLLVWAIALGRQVYLACDAIQACDFTT